MMPNLTNTPQANNILAVSQVDLNNNFNYIQSSLNKDHQVQFNMNSGTVNLNQGLHRQVSLLGAAANPALLSPGVDSMIWSNAGILYWKNAAFGTAIQLTNPAIGILKATNGYSWLPGGMLIQWGQSTTTSNAFPAAPTVAFQTPFSAAPYTVQCSVFNSPDAGKLVQVVAVTAANFQVTTRDSGGGKVNPVTYSWLAIGPA
jgi:hypothetical protein